MMGRCHFGRFRMEQVDDETDSALWRVADLTLAGRRAETERRQWDTTSDTWCG
jgi:hypothetical protein